MKKLFIIAFAAMVAMNVSAQLNVWENGGLSAQYAIENVDSVTFGITNATPSSGTGKDGITPLLKIENDYWFISYDEGTTWQQEGKAKGEKGDRGDQGIQGVQGETGPRGEKGDKGDSMFQAVTQDSNFVYLTLLDSTVIKIAKGTSTGEDQPNSEFMFIVTYDANGGEGVMRPDTFYYGNSQDLSLCGNNIMRKDHIFTSWNTKKDGSGITYKNGQNLILNKNVTLYAQWKENKSGAFSVSQTKQVYFSLGNLQYQANNDVCRFALEQWEYLAITAHKTNENADLFCWGTGANITFNGRNTTFTDWGINQIDLDGYNTWRTLSSDEWEYIRAKRDNADSLWILATVNNIYGIILLPDDWEYPAGITYQNASNLDVKQWYQMETNGAVFLPAAGNIYVQYKGSEGYYWSSSSEDRYGLCFHFGSTYGFNGWYQQDKRDSMSVRLVKEAK